MNKLALALALLITAFTTGCATSYQSTGFTGGHSEMKGPGNLEIVRFSANGYTSAELAQKYALYRCAELAQARGKPFFIMYGSLNAAARDLPGTDAHVGLIGSKPVATAYILLLDAPRPGVHDTRATLEDLRSVVATGKVDPS